MPDAVTDVSLEALENVAWLETAWKELEEIGRAHV